jgi:hypothetical protein
MRIIPPPRFFCPRLWFLLVVILSITSLRSQAQKNRMGLSISMQVYDSFNNLGGGPMLSVFHGRHELGLGVMWLQFTNKGLVPCYRFGIPRSRNGVYGFLQVTTPFSRMKGLWGTTDSAGHYTSRDGLIKGIHIALGSQVPIVKGLKFTTSAGLGINWIEFVGRGSPILKVTTPVLQFALTYDIPFRKPSAPETPLHPETDPDLWLGVQLESALPVIFATVTSPGATYYHPYAEARITPHVRLQASAWLGSETVYAADTTTRWGVRGIGLAARFHSQQLCRLQFFHTVGLEIVPRPYGQLYKSHIHLANGFSYDIAHRANLEAGMNLRFNTEGYYLAPFLGVAVPLALRKKLE